LEDRAVRKATSYSCLALALVAITAAAQAKKDKAAGEATAVNAIELTKEWKKYEGKMVIVEGKFRTKTRILGVVLELDGYKAPKEKEGRRVLCNLKAGAKVPALKPGDTVKVRGKCEGLNGYSRVITVELKNCEMVE
jgi:hypothetical protein